MTDYRRMIWQYWANRIATWARYLCIFLMVPETYELVKYHFPLWDDIAMPVTVLTHQFCGWIQYHTNMYRFDTGSEWSNLH